MDNWFLKFETKYDLSVLKKFNRYNLYSKPTTCITTVMALLLIVIGLLSGSFDVTYRLIFCCIGALWIIEMIFLPGIYAKSTIKTSKLNNVAIVEVTLDSNNISMITRKGDSVVSTATIDYDDVYKICDTKQFIYIYISKNQAVICSKENMEGNYEEGKRFISEKIGKKYKA